MLSRAVLLQQSRPCLCADEGPAGQRGQARVVTVIPASFRSVLVGQSCALAACVAFFPPGNESMIGRSTLPSSPFGAATASSSKNVST